MLKSGADALATKPSVGFVDMLERFSRRRRWVVVLRSRFADGLASGATLEGELALAARIASGHLRGDAVVFGLMQSFTAMSAKMQACCIRTKSGKFMTPELMLDVVSVLGNSREARNLMSMFGVSESCAPRVPLQHDGLPDFYMAIRDTDILSRNVQLALSLLNGTGKRRHHLCMDETCVTPNYDLLTGLRSESGIVGGCLDFTTCYDPAKDETYHPSMTQICKLPQDRRSRLYLTFLLTLTTRNTEAFDVCMVPSVPGKRPASNLFHLAGAVLAAATAGNSNLPPASLAYDGGTFNCMVNAALLGLMPSESMQGSEFWKFCSPCSIGNIPCFPFRLLMLTRN